ncbi:MAG: type II secretion system protein [Dehalococcoidia bacterium]
MSITKSGNRGFTLIELLVVIAILGTLSAVVVLNVTKFIGAGSTEAMFTERSNVQTAVAAYMYDNPAVTSFPATRVSPSNPGILAPYFINSLNCTYNIPDGGAVPNGTKCGGSSPVVVSPVKEIEPVLDTSPSIDSTLK